MVVFGEATTVSGATDSEFKARQERFLLIDFGVDLPIHLGRGYWLMAVTASSCSMVTTLIDTLT